MSKTKADLRRRVLVDMTVIDPEESPSAEQAKTLDLYIDPARSELLEKGLCWWDEDAIPDAVFTHLARYVRAQACGAFGRAGKGFEAYEAPSLSRIAALKSSDQRETTPSEYF